MIKIKIITIFFCLYVLLLPFHSSPYLYDLLRSWSLNYAVLPLLFLSVLILFYQLAGYSLISFKKNNLDITIKFLYFNIYSIFVTILASYFLLNQEIIPAEAYRGPEMNSLKELVRAFFSILSFGVVVVLLKNFLDLEIFVKTLYFSIFIMIIYGYLQIYSIVFCGLGGRSCDGDYLQSALEGLSPLVDQGWQNEKRITPYPNSFLRINLFTPEAATAASLILVYVLPILLASILSGFSFLKNKLFGFSFETYFFILITPILFFTFSSSGLVTFFIIMIFLYGLSFIKKDKTIFSLVTLLSIIFLIVIIYTIYQLGLFSYAEYFVLKIFDLSVGSTNTRVALLVASMNLFTAFPLGVGMGNHETMLINYLPYWSLGNYEILKGAATENLPTLNFWLNILTGNGIIGFVLFLLFLRSIWKKIFTRLTYDMSGFSQFKSLSFIFFLISFTLLSFAQSNTAFLWIWSILGFYTALANIELEKND